MLQYGSFTTLGEWAKQDSLRTGCSKRVAEWALWGQLYLDKLKRDQPWLENCTLPSGVGDLPIGESASQCSSYAKEGVRKTPKKAPSHATNWHGQRNGPRTPLHQDPSRVYQWGRFWVWQNRCAGGVCASSQWTSPLADRRNTWQSYIIKSLSWHMARSGLWVCISAR